MLLSKHFRAKLPTPSLVEKPQVSEREFGEKKHCEEIVPASVVCVLEVATLGRRMLLGLLFHVRESLQREQAPFGYQPCGSAHPPGAY